MVADAFDLIHLSHLKPFIRKTVNENIDNLVKRGCETPVNLVEHFSLPIPSLVCHWLLLLPAPLRVEYLTEY
jgi:nitric oxide reductase